MDVFKVVVTDYTYETLDVERKVLSQIKNLELCDYHYRTEEEVMQVTRDCDVLVVQYAPITRRVIENLDRCRMIIRYAIGVDNIDLQAASERGIYVVNVPDYGIDEVSTHTVCLILAAMRKLPQTIRDVRAGKWNYALVKPLRRTMGSTLGLIGLGRIPSSVAQKMAGFGMRILAYDPYVSQSHADALNVELVDFDFLIRNSDCISIHCPLTAQTHHMFDISVFQKMKPSAFLVNTARGAVIKEEDMITACETGLIAGAAIDVTEKEPVSADSPLLLLDNVILTPHIAWYTEESIVSLKQKLSEEIVRLAQGKTPINVVNRELLKAK